MKNKKFVMALSFCIGAAIFVTTAFADIISKTGYEQFKDSVKYTAECMTGKLNNYTLEGAYVLKDNEKILTASNMVQKFDYKNQMIEDYNTEEFANGEKKEYYSYRDKKTNIYYRYDDETYTVNEYTNERNLNNYFTNPFKEERAKDVEKIFDAFIGDLRGHVVVEENTDGSKNFSGSLSDSQIPAVVNAIASFACKEEFNSGYNKERYELPQLTTDIYIKNIKGSATTNNDGMLESLYASGVISGIDEDGNIHNLTLEAIFKITNINSTVVVKPDMTGKKVEKNVINNEYEGKIDKKVSKKYIGKFKNDIIEEKSDSFSKLGERIVEITNIDDNYVYGKYFVIYNDENAKDNKVEFEFKANIADRYRAVIKDEEDKEVGYIHFDSSRIIFEMHKTRSYNKNYDSWFYRVFE